MLTPQPMVTLAYLVNSSNQSSGYMTGQSGLSGSNIGGRRAAAGYSNFDLAAQTRMTAGAGGSIFVARWGLNFAAFPVRSDWRWIASPT
jgi:hypothetical protein